MVYLGVSKFINGVTSVQLRRREEEIFAFGGHHDLVEVTRFPREDETAPRMGILKKECPNEYSMFMQVW